MMRASPVSIVQQQLPQQQLQQHARRVFRAGHDGCMLGAFCPAGPHHPPVSDFKVELYGPPQVMRPPMVRSSSSSRTTLLTQPPSVGSGGSTDLDEMLMDVGDTAVRAVATAAPDVGDVRWVSATSVPSTTPSSCCSLLTTACVRLLDAQADGPWLANAIVRVLGGLYVGGVRVIPVAKGGDALEEQVAFLQAAQNRRRKAWHAEWRSRDPGCVFLWRDAPAESKPPVRVPRDDDVVLENENENDRRHRPSSGIMTRSRCRSAASKATVAASSSDYANGEGVFAEACPTVVRGVKRVRDHNELRPQPQSLKDDNSNDNAFGNLIKHVLSSARKKGKKDNASDGGNNNEEEDEEEEEDDDESPTVVFEIVDVDSPRTSEEDEDGVNNDDYLEGCRHHRGRKRQDREKEGQQGESRSRRIKRVLERLPPQVAQAVREREAATRMMSPDTAAKHKEWLDAVYKLPLGKYAAATSSSTTTTSSAAELLEHAQRELDGVTHGMQDVKRIVMQLAGQQIRAPGSRMRALGLQGPPGCGKTTLATRGIGPALRRPVHVINLGGAKDAHFLRGHGFTYVGSQPGAIAEALMLCDRMDPVLVFDELDKVSDSAEGKEIMHVLMSLVDPAQNAAFKETYLNNVPLDLSRALIVFTFNDAAAVDPILMDRLNVATVSDLSSQEKREVLTRYIVPRVAADLGVREIQCEPDAVTELLRHSCSSSSGFDDDADGTRRTGLRGIEKLVEHVVAAANLRDLLSQHQQHNGRSDTDATTATTRLRVTVKDVEEAVKTRRRMRDAACGSGRASGAAAMMYV